MHKKKNGNRKIWYEDASFLSKFYAETSNLIFFFKVILENKTI